ncbi:MAG: hypothetical protein K0S37_3842 [Microbacterium sp.]|jgi:hypothetical protein|nr:hypothetical protein [Microbacterium sp.]
MRPPTPRDRRQHLLRGGEEAGPADLRIAEGNGRGAVDAVVSSVAVADGAHVQVTRDLGDLVTLKIKGTTVYSAVDAANASPTGFGIAGSNADVDTRYGNMRHTPWPRENEPD